MKLTLSITFVMWALTGLLAAESATVSDEYPGVIELVGFSNRRARTHYNPPENEQSKTKMAADIETVKQNIEKYNKLLKVDTRNLPESQKEILERIVERVARLKESLDISNNEENATKSNESLSAATESLETTIYDSQTTDSDLTYTSSDTSSMEETTKNPDATTIAAEAQLSLSTAEEDSDEIAAKEIPSDEIDEQTVEEEVNTDRDTISDDVEDGEDIPTSTITSEESDDDEFVAARSNNNNHRTLVSTSSIISKTKSRPNSTKRPGSSSTKSSSSTSSLKRVNGQKPLSMIGSSMKATMSYTTGSVTTVQPMVKIQKPLIQQKEPETMMKVQHQLPQKQQQKQQPQQQQQQQQQANKLQNYQQEQVTASSLVESQQQQQTDQKTISPTIQQSVQIQQRTPILGAAIGSMGNSNTAASSLSSDMLYDSNVNTSSIIESLNNAREEFYNKAGINNKDKKPSPTAKPTKYHYYPHNQHIYLLPECAIQQVCNAVYVRLNYTQPLCACPSRYRDPCSASLNEDDQHTTKLVGDGKKKAITLAKTCEATTEMRECRSPKDWSLLALQNTRTGKSHYLVICRCPDHFKMEGPMAHDQPTYASVPGIRVFGMMCVKPGYSVRKPSAQPPKRYQLQKPYYIPNSQNKYSSIKDHSRPSYGSSSSSLSGSSSSNYQPQNHHTHDSFQNQHQANYQYLNRPDSGSSHFASSSNLHGHTNHNSHNEFPESISFSGSIYGRNNERNGEKPIPAVEDEHSSTSSSPSSSSSSTTSSNNHSSSSSSPITSATKSEEVSRITTETDETPTTLDSVSQRSKRSIRYPDSEGDDESTPEFPWHRVIEFQRSIVWD